MRLRVMLIVSCALIASCIVLFKLPRWFTAFGQGAPEIAILNPVGSFAITTDSSLQLLATNSAGGVLWLLFEGHPSLELTRLNVDGLIQGASTLSAADTSGVDSFCAGEDGRFGVVYRDGQAEIYSQDGKLANSLPIGMGPKRCAFVDNTPYLFSFQDNVVLPLEGLQATVPSPRQHAWSAIAAMDLGNHSLGIVDQVDGRLDVLDTQAGGWQSQQLQAPEIQQMQRTQPGGNTAAATFSSVSSDLSSGDIFTVVSPLNVSQGAIVLRFSRQGILLNRYRCAPPPKSPTLVRGVNKDGHFSPSNLVVLSQRILLISRSQDLAVLYSLN